MSKARKWKMAPMWLQTVAHIHDKQALYQVASLSRGRAVVRAKILIPLHLEFTIKNGRVEVRETPKRSKP